MARVGDHVDPRTCSIFFPIVPPLGATHDSECPRPFQFRVGNNFGKLVDDLELMNIPGPKMTMPRESKGLSYGGRLNTGWFFAAFLRGVETGR